MSPYITTEGRFSALQPRLLEHPITGLRQYRIHLALPNIKRTMCITLWCDSEKDAGGRAATLFPLAVVQQSVQCTGGGSMWYLILYIVVVLSAMLVITLIFARAK